LVSGRKRLSRLGIDDPSEGTNSGLALDFHCRGLPSPLFVESGMPASRRAMRKIVDVLRLKFETGLSHERIAAATKVSKGAVTKYVRRALDAGLG
jgi:hypothetical protein